MGAQARSGIDFDLTAVFLDDRVADAQSQAGSLPRRLGREKGIEDLVADGRVNPAAAVDDVDLHAAGDSARTDGDFAACRTCVNRINTQVEHHLVDLRGRADHARQRSQLDFQNDVLKPRTPLDEVQR